MEEDNKKGIMASNKNITLMEEDERTDYFIMRKIAKGKYRIKITWPLSICQGFVLGISAILHKPIYC